jgi:subtilisin family serine protease
MISVSFRKSLFILLLLLLTAFLFTGKSIAADYGEGEVLVKFRAGADRARADDLHRAAGAMEIVEFKDAGIEKIKLPSHISVPEAVEYYRQDPDVEYAEPNYIIQAAATFPNDTDFAELWGLHNTGQSGGTFDADIDAPEAWDTTIGSGNVVIAVIDSGIDYNHPDLASNIWINSGETNCSDNIDNDGNAYTDDCRGWDFVDDDADPMDFMGHGTHIAGTIAAIGNNNTGIAGVMWTAKIIPLRILDITGSGFTDDAIAAIAYAKGKGAKIINTSWVGSNFSQFLKDAIDNSNALVVSSAGNSGTNNDVAPFYPASFDSTNIITVAATTDNDTLAPFSNYGVTSVDIGAPGVNIYSTIPARDTLLYDNFDDGNLLNPTWTVLGTWGVSTEYKIGSYSLADSPGTEYTNNVDSFAQTSALNLAGQTGCKLLYWMRLSLDPGDTLSVEASLDGTLWNTVLETHTASVSGFREFIESLRSLEGQPTVYIRFHLVTDSSGTEDGAYIDNLSITCTSTTFTGTEYESEAGTSMVAPHVTGVAGLLLALHPTLSPCQIRDMILNNVDAVAALSGLIGTGGRLNALQAVLAVPGPDTCPIAVTASAGGGGGGGCFIATAAYGSSLHPIVKKLRKFRDRHLLTNNAGRIFVNTYYTYSPPVAKIIEQSPILKFFTRLCITPLVFLVLFPYLSFSIITLLLLAGLSVRYRITKKKSI